MSGELPDVGAFGALFEEFVRRMSEAAERPESPFLTRLREHLGADPKALPITSVELPETEHPNLQLALDAVLAGAEIIGFSAQHMGMMDIGLTELIGGHGMTGRIAMGPVSHTDVEVGDGRVVECVSAGLYLARRDGAPVALVVAKSRRQPFGGAALVVQVTSPERDAAAALVRDLRAAMREHNVFRGQVISLHQTPDHRVRIEFHAIQQVDRDGVILPDGTLERLERHALGIARESERLLAAGRHLKRGVLLHGPPGTGKTLSVSYLLGAMAGRTTVLLTGHGLGLIDRAVGIARELAPATVVFEDIDLVAAERTMPMAQGGVLFELLNQMEGVDEDADLLFLLTTNRPDVVEPALAARPGRIDLALDVPLPDAATRRRLVALYAGDIALDGAEDELVERTEGLSGAFVKELMRQASLRAGLDDRAPATAADVRDALDELLDDRSALTRRLLGRPADGAAPGAPATPPFPAMLHALGAAGLPVPPGLQVKD